MNETGAENCGCCDGIQTVTPESVVNPPGLPALHYRVGRHGTFFESMLARLSSLCLGKEAECAAGQGSYPLRALTTRSPADPAVAMLDAFAVIGDVLTFYQERIANEGYLRTALERRSVLELAQLVGYRLRPGVAATVFLAYEMETGEPSLIPRGARVQSAPGPGETAQTFETAADLSARYAWNNLKPRQTRPLDITLAEGLTVDKLYFATPTANLKPNDALLLIFDDLPTHQVLRRVLEAEADFAQGITVVTLQPVPVLVVLVVDLLQVAELALAAELPRMKVDPNLSAFAPTVEGIIWIINRVLENMRLGNYPQPLIGLSHDQIYTLLSAGSPVALAHRVLIVGEPDARASAFAEDPFFVFLSQAFKDSSESVRMARTPAAEADPNQRLPKHLANVLIPVLKRASELLHTPSVRDHLACTLSGLTQDGAPTNAAERQALLESLGDEQHAGLYKAVLGLRGTLVKLQSDDSVDQFAGQALALLDDLAGLAWQPAAAAQARDTLTDLFRQLEAGQDHGEFEIRSIRRSYSPEIARDNLKNLQGFVKAIPENKALNCLPAAETTTRLADLIGPLSLPPAPHPVSPAFLANSPSLAFRTNADAAPRMLLSYIPQLRGRLYAAWAAALLPADVPPLQAVHALRLTAAPFGYNAPQKIKLRTDSTTNPPTTTTEPAGDWTASEDPQTLFADSEYGSILPGSYMIIRKADSDLMASKVVTTTVRPRTEYSMSGKTTRLALTRAWWNNSSDDMATLRSTTLYGQSEALPLAPVPDPSHVKGAVIELDGLYNDLDSGRWLIVAGERADIPGVTGVQDAELVMLLGVTQSSTAAAAGSTTASTEKTVRTTLTLSAPLSYEYKRDTVIIYGNVVKATQGETRNEVLGSGDASQPFQQFALRQPPLTFIAAATPTGTASTLEVRVNDLLWHEAGSLIGLSPNQRSYLTQTNDDGVTTVIFGDGQRGARPPTGVENITALYRNGIGKGGNVRPSQISLMLTRPLHARSVTNPLPGAGGADPDTRDQARRNIPKSVTALDRLVSVRDYADFAATFAGIGKASAANLTDGRHRVVQVTVAGLDDIPITPESDLYNSLYKAMLAYGDPFQPVRLAVRDLLLLVLSADVSLLPDYAWEKVLPKLRGALQTALGFDQRELGQDVYLSQVTAVMQAVPGVAYVDIQALDALDRDTIIQNLPDPAQPQNDDLATRLGLKPKDHILVETDRYQHETQTLLPAQIAFLTPDVPETLILNLREG